MRDREKLCGTGNASGFGYGKKNTEVTQFDSASDAVGPLHGASFLPKWLRLCVKIALPATAEAVLVGPAGRTIVSYGTWRRTMMKRSRHRVPRPMAALLILTVLSVLALTPSGHAAPVQTRTIKIVVGVPPGGAADSLARMLAEQISRTQALSMVVENRP